MEFIDYLVLNAKGIMQLLIGVSIAAVGFSLASALTEATRVIKKINAIIDTLERVLWKPLAIVKDIDKFISKFL